jgi:predicted enzyme related to lactoylglutathione lyase
MTVKAQTVKNRIVMINLAVADLESARGFYEDLLEVTFAEERHGDGPAHVNATFGQWNTDSWFLVALWPDVDRAGTADIGFLVNDLDAAYERALAAGATDVHPPMDIPGMPRVAQVHDPSGNAIGLYQG